VIAGERGSHGEFAGLLNCAADLRSRCQDEVNYHSSFGNTFLMDRGMKHLVSVEKLLVAFEISTHVCVHLVAIRNELRIGGFGFLKPYLRAAALHSFSEI